MRKIYKREEPAEFADWKGAHPNVTYSDLSSTRGEGTGQVKKILRKALLDEQHGLCCYCECKISGEDFHIEHFKPKGIGYFPELQLEYSNLHASCKAQAVGHENDTCGHKKKEQYDPLLISPLAEDCSTHFEYNMRGEIKGIDDAGLITVNMLNLDSVLLNRSRKELLDYFLDYTDEESLQSEIQIHLDQSRDTYGEFFSMIEYLNSHNLLC